MFLCKLQVPNRSEKLAEPEERLDDRRTVHHKSWARPICMFIVTFLIVFKILAAGCGYLEISGASLRDQSAVEKRAKKILAQNPLVDGHNDLLIKIRAHFSNQIYASNFSEPFENGGLVGEVDLPRIHEGSYSGAFWSAFMPCPLDPLNFSTSTYDPIVRATLSQIDLFQRLSIKYPSYFTLSSSASAAKDAFSRGRLISPLAIEGLHQIGNSYSNLRLFYSLGVRYATLTWNCHNIYADAALLSFPKNGTTIKAPPHWGGLSQKGRELVREMNRLGMIVDLSHVSVDTMRDVLVGEHQHDVHENSAVRRKWKGSIAPPIFSHSSAYALCPHPRNVPDDVLQLVKKRNSVVMVNFNPDFISCTPAPDDSQTGLPEFYPPNATLHQVARHIVHIGETVGYDHVGIGTDFDGIEYTPKGLEDVSKFPDLVQELLKMGVEEEAVKKVIGGNVLRVWHEVDKVSARLQKKGWLPAEDELHDKWPR